MHITSCTLEWWWCITGTWENAIKYVRDVGMKLWIYMRVRIEMIMLVCMQTLAEVIGWPRLSHFLGWSMSHHTVSQSKVARIWVVMMFTSKAWCLCSMMLAEEGLIKQGDSRSAWPNHCYSVCIADAKECSINIQHLVDGNPTTSEDQLSAWPC